MTISRSDVAANEVAKLHQGATCACDPTLLCLLAYREYSPHMRAAALRIMGGNGGMLVPVDMDCGEEATQRYAIFARSVDTEL